jgi:hypothetical protein
VSITYTLSLVGGGAYDSTLITFTSTTPSISVYTIDTSKENTYSLLLKGTLTGYSVSSSASFTLIVKDICSTSTISSSTIPSVSYTVSDTAALITTLAWTQSQATCATSISYSLEY